jgi:Domain of unknown function (DUF4124)
MRYFTPLILVAFVMFLLTVSVQAHEQWKWRDKGGKIQYSNLPPPSDVSESQILARPPVASRQPSFTSKPLASSPVASSASAASAPAGPASKASDIEEARRKKAEKDEMAAKRKAEEERIAVQKADSCKRAQAYLKTLQDGIRVSRTNSKGENEMLEDKGRAEETERARDIINKDCV